MLALSEIHLGLTRIFQTQQARPFLHVVPVRPGRKAASTLCDDFVKYFQHGLLRVVEIDDVRISVQDSAFLMNGAPQDTWFDAAKPLEEVVGEMDDLPRHGVGRPGRTSGEAALQWSDHLTAEFLHHGFVTSLASTSKDGDGPSLVQAGIPAEGGGRVGVGVFGPQI